MTETKSDPYAVRDGEILEPPTTLWSRMKYLGPSVIVSGSIVGSGELILTSSLGAAVGFALLWWMLISCWSKSIVQAEIARYVVISGDTYLRAMNRIPGKIGPLSWPVWIALITLIPNTMGLGGLLGGAGQAMSLLFDKLGFTLDARVATGFIAAGTIAILITGSYKALERILIVFVAGFTGITLICAIAMQFTEFNTPITEIVSGFRFEFPMAHIALALAAYGYTGVNSIEISAYTYWCVEKGYPSYIGPKKEGPEWVARAKGWVKIIQTDVWLTLIILTCATLPYYLLGAGVLHKMGERPKGQEAIAALSNMFTETIGGWAVILFAIGAFFILASSVLSGLGAGGRAIPDYLIEMGAFDRSNLAVRHAWTRGYVTLFPILGFIIYLFVENPVLLVTIGGLTTAMMMPIQTFGTIWLRSRRLDPSVHPSKGVKIALICVFLFQALMALLVVRFVVLQPLLD